MSRVLGLDLGPNSIGWAIVDEAEGSIIDAGVRVFPEGLENFDTAKEKSLNEQRRMKRGARRQTARRSQRKARLRAALIEAGLFPPDLDEQNRLLAMDPYALRARALDERLWPHELGRALLHLNQHRGFQSNRKKDRDDKDVKGMLAEINELAADMDRTGARTLGEYLFRKVEALDHTDRAEDDHIRNRHTHRTMLAEEFEAIWNAQKRYHPDLLTDRLCYGRLGRQTYPCKPIARHEDRRKGLTDLEAFGIHGSVFFQRPMYWPTSAVGPCELEPKKKRCPRAHRLAQRFALLQNVNNLRYLDPETGAECALDDGYRQMLLEYLSRREKATFNAIRKKLGFDETVRFNLERGKNPSMRGHVTDWTLAKAAGKEWDALVEDDKTAIVELLLDVETNDEAALEMLTGEHGLSDEQARALLKKDLPSGYIHLSLTALKKLLPHMERGLLYMAEDETNSAMHAAGYLRPDQLQRRIFDRLPDPRRTRDCPIADIGNPVVKRTLVELRKVVNGVIRRYGKPDAIHVEMARSMQMGEQARARYNRRNRQRQAQRDAAAERIRELGVKVTRHAIARYLLWESQNSECMYCGQKIGLRQLFGGEADVDHILPQSLWPDNSQTNKVVCHRKCNADKGQRTPYEWLEEAAYERLCTQARSLLRKGMISYRKCQRLAQKHVEAGTFTARQLVDTGYIARLAVQYLHCLSEHKHDVLGLKGQYTAELRHQWGLGTILAELPDSPAWQEDSTLRDGQKNRADHRHHAVDAIILALTNRARIYQLGKVARTGRADPQTGEYLGLPEPWDDFRADVRRRVEAINVSHRARRKVRGALHEETFYRAATDHNGRPVEGRYVVRKKLEDLSAKEVDDIRDAGIRRIVKQRLAEAGIATGRGKSFNRVDFKAAVSNLCMPSGVPIKRVRVYRDDLTIQPIRQGTAAQVHVKPGSTHHLCLFRWTENGKHKGGADFVTLLKAARRRKRKEPIIQRTPSPDHPTIPPDAQFVMSLSKGEMVLADWNGTEKLLVFKTAASTQGQIYFAEHTDARRSSQQAKYVANANTLRARKVTVTPLGRIRWAND